MKIQGKYGGRLRHSDIWSRDFKNILGFGSFYREPFLCFYIVSGLSINPMSGEASGPSLPSRIASLVHAHFDALPTRSKPTIFPDGSREWVPMTGIVAVKGTLELLAYMYSLNTSNLSGDRTGHSVRNSDLHNCHVSFELSQV
jgi:hypothetical protein